MISKRVFIKAKNDNYSRLAAYIANAGPDGEKCLVNWCEGMLGGEDYAEGMVELEQPHGVHRIFQLAGQRAQADQPIQSFFVRRFSGFLNFNVGRPDRFMSFLRLFF